MQNVTSSHTGYLQQLVLLFCILWDLSPLLDQAEFLRSAVLTQAHTMQVVGHCGSLP